MATRRSGKAFKGRAIFQTFKDKAGEYRWRLRATNKRIIADSAEGYKKMSSCRHGIALVKQAAPSPRIKFQFFRDKRREYRWRLRAANYKIVADSAEGYKKKQDAERGVALVMQAAASKRPRFQLFRDKASEFRWRLRAANGQIIADSGEGYKGKGACQHGIALVRRAAPSPRFKFQVFKDRGGGYRWRLRAANYEIIADSAEGYKRGADCEHGISLVMRLAPLARIVGRC